MTRCSLIACLVLCATFAHAETKNPNNDLSFDGSRAKVYKSTEQGVLKLHIFEPEVRSEQPRPAIVFFFGGGWRVGSPKQFEQQCRYLSSRGMVAMTADYRVSSRHGTKAVEAVQDAKTAIRWVRENAESLHIDPNKVVASGGSAGGHLAATAATIKGFEAGGENLRISSVPNALVLFNPALTLAKFDGREPLPQDKAQEGGGLEKRMGTDPINLSPGHHVSREMPPTIMFFGTEDFLLDGAKYFNQQMKSARHRCEFILYDDQVHGFFNYGKNQNRYFTETMQATDEFLQSIGYLDGTGEVAEWLMKRTK